MEPPRMMSSYVNAKPAQEHVSDLSDGGELRVTLLYGIGPDAGRRGGFCVEPQWQR